MVTVICCHGYGDSTVFYCHDNEQCPSETEGNLVKGDSFMMLEC